MTSREFRHALELISRIPSALKSFDATDSSARSLGLTEEALEEAASLGMAHHVSSEGSIEWDDQDLRTLAIWTEQRTARRSAMKLWLRTLDRLRPQAEFIVEPHASAACPSAAIDYVETRGLFSPRPALMSARVRDFLAQFTDVEFVHLTAAARADEVLLFEERIADCYSFTRHVAPIAAESGLNARASWGVIASVPFSSPHSWIEFQIDGLWVPADIHMASALRAWSLVPGDEDIMQTAFRLGQLYWRWADAPFEPVMSAIRAGHLSLSTRTR